jgi:hypothetical protein
MSAGIAYTLLGLVAAGLLGVGVALWQCARALLRVRGGGEHEFAHMPALSDVRAALLDEKRALLHSLKDLQYEREVGKISPEDFEQLSQTYRRRARQVLQQLDEDIEPYAREARQLLEQARSARETTS